MSTQAPSQQTLRAAGNIVAEYARIAFQERFLRWSRDINEHLAEFIWNCGGMGLDKCQFTVPGPPVDDLVRTLIEARRTRWAAEDFMVLGLQSQVRDGELVFAFSLTWDECETLHPVEMTVEMPGAGPTLRN